MKYLRAAAVASTLLLVSPAHAQLNVLCSVQAEWCNAAIVAFEKQTGIKVAMTMKGSGESIAQISAEKENPKTDVWFGGTGDPHLQAAELNLTMPYASPMLDQLHPWAKGQSLISGQKTVGIYAGALGIAYNPEVLARKKLAVPKCWADLIKPAFKGEIQVADPNSSGTSYTMLATMVQLMGEDKAFDYMKALHKNVNQYTKSGAAPARAAAVGETIVGITFMHDGVTHAVDGAPLVVVAPCEGTGYEIGSMSIIKGARNLENAKKWYDFALGAQIQGLGANAKSYQVPSNKNAATPPQAPKLSEIKLIKYDFKKYGSTAERTRLLAKWDKEVKVLPK